MKIVRATDIHFDSVKDDARKEFINEIKKNDPEIVLVGGDIGDHGRANDYLQFLSENLWQDIYYVLGNHDFYQRRTARVKQSIAEVRKSAVDTEKIRYLTNRGAIHLDENTSIIGHDGWGDGQNGYVDSAFMAYDNPHACRIRDFYEIVDLNLVYNQAMRPLFIQKLKELGEEAANHLLNHLPTANKNVIVLTHVPPFNEACFYYDENKKAVLPQNEFWSPFFSCKATGDVLLNYAEQNPDKNILVLAGHTHAKSDVKIKKNLRVIVGQGDYGNPKLDVIDTDEIFKTL